jgi:excisionase family DNA binding protein
MRTAEKHRYGLLEASGARNSTARTAPKLMDAEQAAKMLGVTTTTLYRWRKLGQGPSYIRVGIQIRYSADDLDAFIAAGRVSIRPDEAKSA